MHTFSSISCLMLKWSYLPLRTNIKRGIDCTSFHIAWHFGSLSLHFTSPRLIFYWSLQSQCWIEDSFQFQDHYHLSGIQIFRPRKIIWKCSHLHFRITINVFFFLFAYFCCQHVWVYQVYKQHFFKTPFYRHKYNRRKLLITIAWEAKTLGCNHYVFLD